MISQHGGKEAVPLSIQTFSSVARLDRFVLHAGDTQGVLKGSRLDELAKLVLGGVTFLPGDLDVLGSGDVLTMHAQDAEAASALRPDRALPAIATLRDGRVLRLTATIEAARPRVSLIAKSISALTAAPHSIQLASEELLPLAATLTFSLRAQLPASFSREQSIEIASADQSFSTTLSLANGGIRLENAKVAVATLDPEKAFGSSAFGPLRFRVLLNGMAGDWQPLVSLVRLPRIGEVSCPASTELACRLTGKDLFLIDSVSTSARFESSTPVPDGFPGSVLLVPRPTDGRLYIKLRDDPAAVHSLAVESMAPLP